jgi:hypothetical protein
MLERFLLKQRELLILFGNYVDKDDALIFKVFLTEPEAEFMQRVFEAETVVP